MPENRLPAPPNYRTRRPGRGRARTTAIDPTAGRRQTNMCVSPRVTVDMLGNRIVFEIRRVKLTNPIFPTD